MRTVFAKGLLLAAAFAVIAAIPPSVFSEDLCVQLKWHHQSQFAGFYLAKEEGLYEREGLDVTFVEGGPQIQWQEKFNDAACPIGISNSYEIVIAKSREIPVMAIAAIDQVSPIVWFALEESGIRDPRQFRGKKVVQVPTGKIHLRGMLKKVGIPFDAVTLEPFSMDMTPLYRGDVDIWSGYVTNLVTRAEEEGHKVNVIHPINYGIQIYDDVIYAREDLITNSPDIVERFLRASLHGWLQTIRDPERAVRHSLRYSNTKDEEHERGLLWRTIPYIHTGEVPIGWMEKSVWEDICFLTKEVGLIDRDVFPDNLYTDRFLRAIYDDKKSQ